MSKRIDADVVIAGSGAGGATVAGELLRAGARVVVVEAGPVRFGAPGLHGRNLDTSEAALADFGKIIAKEWVYPCKANGPIKGLDGLWVSHGVGGMFSIFCSNLPYPDVAELPEWMSVDEWTPYLTRSAALLHANADIFGRGVRAGRILDRVTAAIGRDLTGRPVQHMPIAVRETPTGLKFTGADDLLAGEYNPDNLTLITDHVVRRIEATGSRATGLVIAPAAGGEEITVNADAVVIAAGPIATPQIVAASKVDAGPALGRYILDHPIISTRVLLKPEIVAEVPANDPLFSVWVPFSKDHPFQNEVFRFPQTPPAGTRDEDGADVATFVAMEVNPDNRIQFSATASDGFGLPEVAVTLVHSEADQRRIAAAAAENYLVSAAVSDTRQGWFPVLYKAGGSAHLMGSCRMGPKPDGTSVVDRNGRFWNYDNLYAAGNATLAVPSGANPTFTTVAAALMTADHIKATRSASAAAA
ncbi:GMC oxidoreductase [Ancylobacter sp. WKF20]|uniref:GMC oxidoreductase n=1 Tax=Ancylobacter sp. WKF20 TaxID=3039801 RepID=UPI002434482C|nr:GMC oxidoreductase [Ancylobacter sp. WKF20]WGD29745.1 GMC oxidoreductase [Ancylobacter sp. WKF20]